MRSNFLCAVAIIFFATGFPILDILLKTWGVISVALFRNTLALIFIFVIWIFYDGQKKVFDANWRLGFVIGSLGFGIGSILLIVAQSLTNSVVAALAAALMPLAAVLLEIFFDNRRLSVWFLLGTILVLVGGVISIGYELLSVKFGSGLILAVISVTSFAWGSRATVKKIQNATLLEKITVTTFGMACLSLFTYIICLLFDIPLITIPSLTVDGAMYLLTYSWIALALSQLLWIHSVKNFGIGIASFHLNLAPFYVMVILFFMGRDWIWFQFFGASIVLIGVLVSQKKAI